MYKRQLLDVVFRAGIASGDVAEEPDYKLEFKPLWSLSDTEQATVDQIKAQTALVKAQTCLLYTSSITGYGADLLIVDDPIKNRAEAESATYRDKLWDEYQSTVSTRLHAGGAVIIILTRWHEDDLAARLLNPEYGKVEDWDIISLPAICEDPATDPLGRELGEALWPAGGYDEAWAAQQKETVGTYAWSSLYMQTPTPSSGGMFKREWWKRWAALPSGLHDFIQSWDCTFKDKDGSDFVVGQVWARKGACLLYTSRCV